MVPMICKGMHVQRELRERNCIYILCQLSEVLQLVVCLRCTFYTHPKIPGQMYKVDRCMMPTLCLMS